MDPVPDPRQRVLRQAAHCRAAFRALTDEGRLRARARLRPGDPVDGVWVAALSDPDHPLARWLAGDEPAEALPARFPEGPSPRQVFSPHPFPDFHPWSTRTTSSAFYSTPQG